MTVTDPYDSGELVYAREAGNLVLTDIDSTDGIAVSILADGEEFCSLTMWPDAEGTLTIRLRDLLSGVMKGLMPDLSVGETSVAVLPTISIEIDSEAIWEHQVIDSFAPGGNSKPYWLSYREQSSKTHRDAVEVLSALLPARTGDYIWRVYAKAWLRGGTYVEGVIWKATAQYDWEVLMLDASASAIAEALSVSDSSMIAYDVWVQLDDPTYGEVLGGTKRRYVLSYAPHYGYIFRNSLGGWETVYAYGKRALALESEAASFTNGGYEEEVDNDAVRKTEQDSGWIVSARQSLQWDGFLTATERYAIIGGEGVRIVVDSVEDDRTIEEASSLTFTWHRADAAVTTPVIEDGDIDDFSI